MKVYRCELDNQDRIYCNSNLNVAGQCVLYIKLKGKEHTLYLTPDAATSFANDLLKLSGEYKPAADPTPNLTELVTELQAQVESLKEVIETLVTTNTNFRQAGNKMCEASLRVINEYDGTHRLALACAKWLTSIANEMGREERHAE